MTKAGRAVHDAALALCEAWEAHPLHHDSEAIVEAEGRLTKAIMEWREELIRNVPVKD